ncbi:MAG TPA: hypothetical protein VF545_03200 [Thermoleophilaceae bacterium]|jgi:hypothetical protein
MSLLIVNAASEDTIAGPGNRSPNYVVVSVTDSVGTPVTGLVQRDFQVQPILRAPGGTLVNIEKFAESGAGLPGYYILYLVPVMTDVQTGTWKAGTYVFGVSVTRGTDRGQNLASVLMD